MTECKCIQTLHNDLHWLSIVWNTYKLHIMTHTDWVWVKFHTNFTLWLTLTEYGLNFIQNSHYDSHWLSMGWISYKIHTMTHIDWVWVEFHTKFTQGRTFTEHCLNYLHWLSIVWNTYKLHIMTPTDWVWVEFHTNFTQRLMLTEHFLNYIQTSHKDLRWLSMGWIFSWGLLLVRPYISLQVLPVKYWCPFQSPKVNSYQ